jgi:hypothetical protein
MVANDINYKDDEFSAKLNSVPAILSNSSVSGQVIGTPKKDLASEVERAITIFLIEDTRHLPPHGYLTCYLLNSSGW